MRTTHLAGIFCIGLAVFGQPSPAPAASVKSASGLLKTHTKLIDKRLTRQYSASSKALLDGPNYTIVPRYSGAYKGTYLPLAEAAARKYGIPEDLFKRLVQQESGWNPNAKSPKGALGLAQLMPQTARSLGVNPRKPVENLDGGARYLKQQYNRFRSWKLALAAYNAGPEAVAKYNGVPPYKETRNYVYRILGQ